MGRNGIDDDASAPDAAGAPDAPERAARGEEPCPIPDAPETRLEARRPPSLRVVSRPRARIGRPTRLTPALAAAVVEAVRATGWIRPAARRCGLDESTVRGWVQRGKGEHPSRGATRAHVAFARAIEKAQSEWETAMLARITAAADAKAEHWTAAAWSLERFDPENYGRRNRVDVSGTVTLVEVRALLTWVAGMVERYVPESRREAELADLAALTGQLAGGAAQPPALAPGR